MKKSTHRGKRNKRKIMVNRIADTWTALIGVAFILIVCNGITSKAANEPYTMLEDEATTLSKFGVLMTLSGIQITIIGIGVLAVVLVILLVWRSFGNYKISDGGNKSKELTARRVNVGASLDNVEEFSSVDSMLEDEKVTFSRTVKVLLVEDNQINMDVAQYMLEENGIIVHLAKDGREAVDMFTKLPAEEIDVILMDVMMPVMNGIEATKAIRALDKENAKTIPIIALTASQNEEDIQWTKEAGMNEYLSKPFDIDITLSTIKKYIK